MSDITEMQWEKLRPTQAAQAGYAARKIVAWVNDNGGEARYEDHAHMPVDDCPNGPVIAVRVDGGWAYAAPGDYIVMLGTATFHKDEHGVTVPRRDFSIGGEQNDPA